MMRVLRLLFSIIVFVAILFVAFFGWDKVEEQWHHAQGVYYIYKGDKAYFKNNMSKTLYYYKKGLELYPEHYEAWFNLGNIYAVHEDYFAAIEAYKQAIKNNPKFILARMNLGIVYSEDLGDFDSAIEQYDAIINNKYRTLYIPKIYNNKISTKSNMGVAYYNKGLAYRLKSIYLPDEKRHLAGEFVNKAIASYKNAQKFLKKDYANSYNMGLAYHVNGDYSNAAKSYCQAIEYAPMNFEAHYNLAVLLRHLNYYKESLDEFQKAALIISENPNATNQALYVFNLLNEATRLLLYKEQDKVTRLTDEPILIKNYTYVGGKVVPSEELDKVILDNFRKCSANIFLTENEND